MTDKNKMPASIWAWWFSPGNQNEDIYGGWTKDPEPFEQGYVAAEIYTDAIEALALIRSESCKPKPDHDKIFKTCDKAIARAKAAEMESK